MGNFRLKFWLIPFACLCMIACGAQVWLYRWNKAKISIVNAAGEEVAENSELAYGEVALRISLQHHHVSEEYSSGIGPHPKKSVMSNDKFSTAQIIFLGERTDAASDTLRFIHNAKAGYTLRDTMPWADFIRKYGTNPNTPETEFYLFLTKQPTVKSAKIALSLEVGRVAVLRDTSKMYIWD